MFLKPVALLALAVFVIASPMAFACEPPAFNFTRFLADNDKNKDGFLQKQELLKARTEGYDNTLDKPVNTEEAFKELDKNKDKKLSLKELWAWGKYNHNGCEHFDMRGG